MTEGRFRVVFNYIDDEHVETRIASYATDCPAETLKVFMIAQKHDVIIYPNNFDDCLNHMELVECGVYVDSINIIMGSEKSIPCIEVNFIK